MPSNLSPKTKQIAEAAERYATARAVDGLDFQRLRNAFLEGASCGVDVMREIHAEVTAHA